MVRGFGVTCLGSRFSNLQAKLGFQALEKLGRPLGLQMFISLCLSVT